MAATISLSANKTLIKYMKVLASKNVILPYIFMAREKNACEESSTCTFWW